MTCLEALKSFSLFWKLPVKLKWTELQTIGNQFCREWHVEIFCAINRMQLCFVRKTMSVLSIYCLYVNEKCRMIFERHIWYWREQYMSAHIPECTSKIPEVYSYWRFQTGHGRFLLRIRYVFTLDMTCFASNVCVCVYTSNDFSSYLLN